MFSGVDDVDVDMAMQKVTVMGWADQKKVLKTVRKTGKKAELYPYNPEYHGFIRQYGNIVHDIQTQYSSALPSSSYNYYKHGYNNGDDFGYYRQPVYSTVVDEKTMSIFSDENPHACSIM